MIIDEVTFEFQTLNQQYIYNKYQSDGLIHNTSDE